MGLDGRSKTYQAMKKHLIFFVPMAIMIGFLISCSPQEAPIPYITIDTSKVYLNPEPDTIFINEFKSDSSLSEITCPKCNFKKKESMPTDVCLLKYTCTGCRAELFPKEGDCCVFCTYGTEKCPSKQ